MKKFESKKAKVDPRNNLGPPQEFAEMVGLASGGHIFTANVPQPESMLFILYLLIIFVKCYLPFL